MSERGEWLTMEKTLLISVDGEIVTLEIVVGDNYEAQILFEDLVTRFQNGEMVTLGCQQSTTTKTM